ncbi:unnamed protein product [Paramecium primaurelia]|uniref:Uncharacterized protein n=1 Tax=Paramecium primaurelia TaxID=5886 RepID=A0A8S1P8I2_PARPR|nr:unnamed protein product [Paramecium primaurelia]
MYRFEMFLSNQLILLRGFQYMLIFKQKQMVLNLLLMDKYQNGNFQKLLKIFQLIILIQKRFIRWID